MDADDVQYVRKNERGVQQEQPKKMLQKKEHTHSKRKKFRELTDAAMKADADYSQFPLASGDEYTPRQDQSASKTTYASQHAPKGASIHCCEHDGIS